MRNKEGKNNKEADIWDQRKRGCASSKVGTSLISGEIGMANANASLLVLYTECSEQRQGRSCRAN